MPLNRIEHLLERQVADSLAPKVLVATGSQALPLSPEERREASIPINQSETNLTGVAAGEAQTFATELGNVFRDLSQVLSHIPDKPSKERFLKDLCALAV